MSGGWGNYGSTWFEHILRSFAYVIPRIPNENAQRRFIREIENCFIHTYLVPHTTLAMLATIENEFNAAPATLMTIGGHFHHRHSVAPLHPSRLIAGRGPFLVDFRETRC